jgi:hypothetical protein
MNQTPTSSDLTPEKALRELWRRGTIRHKLHSVQAKMLEAYLNNDNEITVISCTRRLGKSFLLCLLAAEKCMQTPNAIVKYVCPQKKQVKNNIQPLMNQIFEDCPPEMRPEFKYNDYKYVFPNGSEIQMAGTDNGHHESLRGSKSDLWIVDEAGFCSELKYVVQTILAPTTDTTGGRGILASTPSKTSDHEFITVFLQPAEIQKKLIKYTVYDNPMMTPEKIEEILSRYEPLREENDEFRREYLCEVHNNSELSIIPEFTTQIQAAIIKETVRPPFYDAYVSMDIGARDLTVVLFGYFDFKNGVIVIEDEIVQDGALLLFDKFAKDIIKKEQTLWTNKATAEFKPPYLRVADNNNLIMLNQLSYDQNLLFIPTRKDNKEAALNTVRMKIANQQIIIHPRCETLIYHLKNGSWNKNKTDFARSPDAGHYDAIDSLIYLVRNVQEHKNPYPAGYGFNKSDYFVPEDRQQYTPAQQAWVNIFKSRSSLKS